MDDKYMTIVDEQGNERTVEILFTFEDEKTKKNFVLFQDPDDEDTVYAYRYTEDGDLDAVDDDAEMAMCDEVLNAFLSEGELNG